MTCCEVGGYYMNAENKVSIIIPVFNAASFLDRCIDSVLCQTYQNTEVLLIDDGSTDGSGTLCDRRAAQDSRIRVFHKENCGVSEARNTGLDAALGEYIAFVDSDDYIAPDMIQNLYLALKKNDADMSICNILHIDEDGALHEENYSSTIKNEVLTGSEAISRESDYCHKGSFCYVFVFSKLYKKSLFNGIRFPKGKISEEDYITHKIYSNCKKISCISAIGYYYVQRKGSLLHSNNRQLFINRAEGRLERAVKCFELGLYRSAGQSYWLAAVSLPDAFSVRRRSSDYYSELNRVFLFYRELFYFRHYCTLKEKMQIWIIYLSPMLFQIFFRNSLWRACKKLFR